MNGLTIVAGGRVLVAAFVAVAGLVASAPQLHGSAETRGAVPCNINVIATPDCVSWANYLTCEIMYTKCKSFAGPKDKICTIKQVGTCQADTDCIIRTDWSYSYLCEPTLRRLPRPGAASAGSAASVTTGSDLRPSQVE